MELFLEKCHKEQITSFEDYDERFMVHYRSSLWVERLIEMTEDSESSDIDAIRKRALEALESFGRVLLVQSSDEE